MIRALRRCTACAALAAAVVTLGDFQEAVGAPCAPTGICQSAEVQQLGGLFGGQPLLQDSEGDGGTGTIARDVLAEIPVAGRDPTSVSGFATASVGRFGAFGLSANDFSSNQATTSTDVHIRNSDVYQNSTGAAQHLLQHLIIDGGSMSISTTVPVRNTEADFGYDILVHVGPNPLSEIRSSSERMQL